MIDWEQPVERHERDLDDLLEAYEKGHPGYAPRDVLVDEDWEARDRRERHYDFVLRDPHRESDDWLEEAA